MVFVLLLCLSSLQRTVAQYNLPDYNRTVDYVTTLIQDYGAYVNSNYVHPERIKEYLSLYSGVGDSFKVVVLQSEANDASCVTLIFIPIHQNELSIVLDDNHTLANVLGNQVYVGCRTVFENVAFESGSTVIPVHLMLDIPKFEILGDDYLTNANSTARSLAQEDIIMSGGPSPPSPNVYTVTVPSFVKILQTTTQTFISTSNQTFVLQQPTSSSTPDLLARFYDDPTVKAIDAAFGSIMELVLIILAIIGLIKRKSLIREFRKLVLMDSPQPDKPESGKT
jgi:hypothetical protein